MALSDIFSSNSELKADNKVMLKGILVELKGHTKSLQTISKRLSPVSEEQRVEEERARETQTNLLKRIAENTKLPKTAANDTVTKGLFTGILGLIARVGIIGTALATTLGGILGLLNGHLKALKLFTPKILIDAIASIGKMFKAKVAQLGAAFTKVIDIFVGGIKSLASTKVGIYASQVVNLIQTTLSAIAKPFVSLLGVVTDAAKSTALFGRISQFFRAATGWIKSFGGLIGRFSAIFGRIFYPFTVVLTLWETVKGAIKGFEEDGFIGGIVGAIKGFFNTLVMKPLDLMKDIVSWIAEKLGWKKFSEILDSFSFEQLFSGAIDSIRNLLSNISEWISEKVNSVLGFFGLGQKTEQDRVNERKAFLLSEIDRQDTAIRQQQAILDPTTQEGKRSTRISRDAAIKALPALQSRKEELGRELSNLQKSPEIAIIPGTSKVQTDSSALVQKSEVPSTIVRSNPNQFDRVTTASKEVVVLQSAPHAPASAPVMINAPSSTNISNTSQMLVKTPPRNNESSYQRMMDSRMSW